jgi:hypothetical protein
MYSWQKLTGNKEKKKYSWQQLTLEKKKEAKDTKPMVHTPVVTLEGENLAMLNRVEKPKINTTAFQPKTQPIDIRNKNQNFFTDPQALQKPLTQATVKGLDIVTRPANAAVNVLKSQNDIPEYIKVEGKMYRVKQAPKQDIGTAFIRGITGQDRPEALEITAPKSVIEKAKKEQPFLTGLSEFALATVTDPTTYIGGEALKVVAKKLLGKIPLEVTQKLAKGTAKVEDVAKAAGKTEEEVQRLLDNEAADLVLKDAKPIERKQTIEEVTGITTKTVEPPKETPVHDFNYTPETGKLNSKTWYHGSGTMGITKEKVSPNNTNIEGLYGHGLYLTDDKGIAEGYAKARSKRTNSPVVYQAKIEINNSIDLEKPLPKDAFEIIKKTSKAFDDYFGNGDWGERIDKAFLEGKPGKDIWRMMSDMFSDVSQDGMIPKSELYEYFQDITGELKDAGYDGFTHIGGDIVGKKKHQVAILFDPQGEFSSNTTRNISEFNPVNIKTKSEIEGREIGLPTKAVEPPKVTENIKAPSPVQVAANVAQKSKQGTTIAEREVSTAGKDALISDRKVKAYMFENPEVKDYYQTYAKYILDDEFVPNAQENRITEVMLKLKSDTGLQPAEIKDALERLVKNNGQENVAAAKRVELVIDDMLTNGFESVRGEKVSAIDDYLKLKSEIEGREIKPVNRVTLDDLPVDDVNYAKPVPQQFKGASPGDPDYNPLPIGGRTYVVNSASHKTQAYKFSNPDIETTHQANKGIKTQNFTERAKTFIKDSLDMFKRPISTLPYTKENAELYKDLTRLPKIRAIASGDTVKTLDDIVKPFKDDRNAFDMFERKVLLDDLAEEAAQGNKLPNKWTPDEVTAELQRLDSAMPQSVKDAISKRKQYWDNLKTDYTKAMNEIGVNIDLTKENYFRHQVLEYANIKSSILGSGKKLQSPTGRGFTKSRTGEYTGDINTDYLQAEYEVMAQMKHDAELAKTIKNIGDNYDIADKLKADAKAQGVDWQDLIPEGYTTWQPREGNAFYMAQPLGAQVVDQALALRGITVKGIKDPKIRVALEDIMNDLAEQVPVLAMGAKRKEWVVKNEVAETLNNLAKVKTTNVLARASKAAQSAWKQWILTLNPWKMVKYNIRNFTGDLDGVVGGNVSALKKTGKAGKELYDAMSNGKFTPELKSWYDRGGYQSLLYAQEVSQVNKLKPFEKFRNVSTAEKITKPLRQYKEFTTSVTNYREAVGRYAAYLDYLDQLKSGKLKNYGASRPEIIDGIKSVEDKAFKLSNDLLGAYDEVSQAGQIIRNHLVPFYSWMEINLKRYKNLFKNVSGDKAKVAGLSAKVVAKIGANAAVKIAGIFAMTGALAAWNQIMYPDLEEGLSEDVKSRPHIILGKDDKGNALYFSRMGALNDFLEWFGMGNITQDVKEIMNGKRTVQEQLTDMLKAPANKIAGSITPAIKTPVETAVNMRLYPDVTNPQSMRDRWRNAASSVGLEKEYDVVAGKPRRPYFTNIEDAALYKSDPEEQAYYYMLNEKQKFQKKKGEESTLFFYTKKSNALYNWKLARKYGDKESMKKYIKEYFKLGGTVDGIEKSLSYMDPLYGIKDEDKLEFVKSLTKEDKAKMKLAMKYYEGTIKKKSP